MHNLKIYGWSDGKSFAINVKRGVLNIVRKMQNPLLCKDLQAILALKKHLEKNHTLLSVVSFQSYDKNGILLAWILGEWVEFFLSYDKISFARGVTPVTADGSVKFLPESFKFLQKTTYSIA